ncbi:hypothetical protein NHJ13734_008852 [Beauveria thailandica]
MGLPFLKTPKAALPIEEAKQVPIECPFDGEPNLPPEKSAIRFWILSFGTCLGLFLSIIDSSIVATALFTIGNDFKDLGAINWIALAYTLAYLGCAVAFAHVSDVIGRRDAFLLACVLFFAFSMASGFAQNIHQLIALRTIQGIGGSGLYSLTMVILPEMCPPSHLKFIGSLIGIVIALSGVLGPLLGGALTQFTQWRWIFWINTRHPAHRISVPANYIHVSISRTNRCGLLSTVQGRADDAKALGFLVFAGLGFGLSTAAATMLVTFEATIADAASAHGILAQMRILGGSIGIATATILLRNRLTDVSEGHISTNVEENGAVAAGLAYSSAFRAGMKVCSILSGIAVLVSMLGFRRTRMDMNEQRTKLFREEEIRRANERPQ